jgi:hypothetical protein
MRSRSRTGHLSRHMSAVLAAGVLAVATSAQAQENRPAQGPWGGKTKGIGKYAEVNGIRLYYEIDGTGKPLILLHGGLGAIEMFGPNLSTRWPRCGR